MIQTLRSPLALALASLASLAPSFADVLVVDATGAGDHLTIQGAVDVAADGDIVLVRPGDYPEVVTVAALELTLVSDGGARIIGKLLVRDLGASQWLLVSGLTVEAPPNITFPSTTFEGALDVRNCIGPVRVQDCALFGADGEGPNPLSHPSATPSGGPGVLLRQCEDVALVDSSAAGGAGSLGVVAPSGWGGDGAWIQGVSNCALIRTVTVGGDGGRGDDPGDGGAGARLVDASNLHIAYSALFGGDAGCWEGFAVTPGWTVDGGSGLVRGAGTATWDFEGVFEGGEAAGGLSCLATPAGGSPGQPTTGPGTMQTASGFPNTLHAPAVVREGVAWSVEIVAAAGEFARLFHGSRTTYSFLPAFEQPRLIGGANVRRFPGVHTVPLGQRIILNMPVIGLPAALEGYVHGFQAHLAAPAGGFAFSSPRFVVFLDAAL